MSLTRPRPKSADPIVEIIRREVMRPKPSQLRPYSVIFNMSSSRRDTLRWTNVFMCWMCPMGHCKKAKYRAPYDTFGFPYPEVTNQQVKSFYKWWDDQTDKQAAIRSVFGHS